MNDSREATIDLVYKELEYRRKKQWDIFSWCSTLLVAITGGVIALETRQQTYPLHRSQKAIISLAVAVLVVYAVLWLGHNWRMEKLARCSFSKEIKEHLWGPKHKAVGYRWALVMLGGAALLAIWYPR